MRRIVMLAVCVPLLTLVAAVASANTVASSTLWFEGSLTDAGGGVYTGEIDMTAGYYYVTGGPGAGISTAGGFDVYAKTGGTSYISVLAPPSTYTVGVDHDGYPKTGTPWGTCDPDCGDYDRYSLKLTSDHWDLLYREASGFVANPMSGTMNWTTMSAVETDLGTSTGNGTAAAYGGGAGAWDCDWGWLIEAIPLQFSGFAVNVTPIEGDNYRVSLTPAPIPEPISMIFFGTGVVGVLGFVSRRKMRRN